MWSAAGLLFLFSLAPGFQTPLLYYQQDVLKLDPRLMGLLQVCAGIGWIVGAALYSRLCRRFPLRLLLVAGIALNGLGTLLFLRYDSAPAAATIEAVFGVLFSLGALPLYDLAARATPKGSESFGFGLMLSIASIGQFAISDPSVRCYTRGTTSRSPSWSGSTPCRRWPCFCSCPSCQGRCWPRAKGRQPRPRRQGAKRTASPDSEVRLMSPALVSFI